MSTNPLQRIADLEAQVAALTAENTGLRSRSNGNGNGNGHLDLNRLLDELGSRIDRSGQVMREDFTGKLAGLIAPYIDTTLRRCTELEEKQDDLEATFEQHRQNIVGAVEDLDAVFEKKRKQATKDWEQHRAAMQEDFGRVDGFVKWFTQQLEESAIRNNHIALACVTASEHCMDAARKVSAPTDEIIKHLEALRVKGEESIKRAERSVTEAHKSVRPTVAKMAAVMLAAAIFIQMGFGALTLWRNRKALDIHWDDLVEHSEQQKRDIQAVLDKALSDAKEAQIEHESKVKMFDALMLTLAPRERDALWARVRDQVRKGGEKRLDDQMSAGYERFNGAKR